MELKMQEDEWRWDTFFSLSLSFYQIFQNTPVIGVLLTLKGFFFFLASLKQVINILFLLMMP